MTNYFVLSLWISLAFITMNVENVVSVDKERHSGRKQHHTHHRPDEKSSTTLLQDKDLLRDREHLKEELPLHLSELDVENMNVDELEYHYFRTHDFDKDDNLDGLEMMVAMSHIVHHAELPLEDLSEDQRIVEKAKRIEIFHNSEVKSLEKMVDQMLIHSDVNKDGFISYAEYVTGRMV